jgi:hypothetical protein
VPISLRRKADGASATRFDVVLRRAGTGEQVLSKKAEDMEISPRTSLVVRDGAPEEAAEYMEISPRKGVKQKSAVARADTMCMERWQENLEERAREIEKKERSLERNKRQMLEEMKEKEREIRHRMEMAQRGVQTRHKEAQTDESIGQRAWDDEQARRC